MNITETMKAIRQFITKLKIKLLTWQVYYRAKCLSNATNKLKNLLNENNNIEIK